MDLISKNAAAPIPPSGLANLMAALTWSTGRDFDLMVFAKTTSGERKLFFYGSKGDLNTDDLMLGADKGVGNTAGTNQEDCFIQSLDKYTELGFVVADYSAIEKGTPAEFATSDIKCTLAGFSSDVKQIVDHKVVPDGGMAGNICLIGKIVKQGPIYVFKNETNAHSMKGLGSVDGVFDAFGM